jgi:hypothetical protein
MLAFPEPPAAVGTLVDAKELTHNAANDATGGIWLVTGSSGAAVLKIAKPPSGTPSGSAWPTSDEPTHWNYWRREALAYSTGLVSSYAPFGITTPALLSSATQTDGSLALWLSVVSGTPAISWTPAELGSFAHRLGAAQGSFIDRIPAVPWLSRSWLESYLGRTTTWVRWEVDWSHPLAAVWPASVRSALAALWESRSSVLARARASSPATLAHLDVWPMNIIGTSLLDWSFAGAGGIGEDPANLIIDSVTDGLMPASYLPEIESLVISSYVDGLRSSGSALSFDAVRRAIRLYGAAKYAWFGVAVMGRAINEGTLGHANYRVAESVEESLARHVGLVTMIADWSRTE